MIYWSRFLDFVVVAVLATLVVACSPRQASTSMVEGSGPAETDPRSFAELALREKVSDSLAIRPSWQYYQYGLQAMENQEWDLARHYFEQSLNQLVAEKFDTLYMNVSEVEDSLYRVKMPERILSAMDEVYPNLVEAGKKEETYLKNEVAIEGVDDLDENEADSASLLVIENFLDTVDVRQFTLPIEFNERVQQEIFYMTTTARSFTEGSLNRKTAYDSLISAALAENGLPKDLVYLALVESGFKVKAYSRAKASGMWQFIPETGKRYGLDVNFWVDMRRNPVLATDAAAKYLSRLYDEFGDWLLAMAAYNCGEGRVRRLIAEMKADTTRDSSQAITYWDLALPKETMRYVPRILAAMVIGHFPEHYEMNIVPQHLPEYDTVTVFDSFSLEQVAKAIKVPEDTLRDLNMELVMWCTPPDKSSYVLRLPVGKRPAFVDNYDKMEKNNFSSWAHHKVRRGENLGMIARKYGISVSEIKQANNMKNSRIRVGRNLLIPVKVKPRKSSGKKPAKVKIYVAKLGDNIASVARMYGVSQESLRTWNSMSASAMIKSGDTLFVSKPELKPAAVTPTKVPLKNKYVVESGDTYASIAKLFGIPVVSLLYANDGFSKRLHVGDTLAVPSLSQLKKKASKADKKQKVVVQPSAVQASSADGLYTVQAGDNLYSISRRFSTTTDMIRRLNNMGTSNAIHPGQVIRVQGEVEDDSPVQTNSGEVVHTVKKGEGLWDIARQYKVTIEEIVRWNGLKDTKVKAGDRLKIVKNP